MLPLPSDADSYSPQGFVPVWEIRDRVAAINFNQEKKTMTKYVAIGLNHNGAVISTSSIKLCPADLHGWAKAQLMSDKIVNVQVFEHYGTYELERAPIVFTPAEGAEPPGRLPEPPTLHDRQRSIVEAALDDLHLRTAKTGR